MTEQENQPTSIPMWVCSDCGNNEPTKTIICPMCNSQSIDIQQSKGYGTIVASTIIRRPSADSLFDEPFCLCVVRMDEQVLISGHYYECRLIESGTRVWVLRNKHQVPIFTDTVAN